MRHSSDFIHEIFELFSQPGGQTLLVLGDGNPKNGWYRVGTRFPPVKTLLEAVLRCVMMGPYQRIIACTGQNENHLPNWTIGVDFQVGALPTIWRVRGEKVQTKPPLAPSTRNPFERSADSLKGTIVEIDRLRWRQINEPFWDRFEKFFEMKQEEERAVGTGRGVVVMDFLYLWPSSQDSNDLLNKAQQPGSLISPQQAQRIQTGFARSFQGTKLDLILFAEEEQARQLLDGEAISSVLAQGLARHVSRQEWEATYQNRVGPILPRLTLGQQTRLASCQRQHEPLPRFLETVAGSVWDASLYRALRTVVLSQRPSTPTPPVKPDEVALEFWANIDLTPLTTAFRDKIFGQTHIKQAILGRLEKHKDDCTTLLERSAQARRTWKDTSFLLPVIGLFGAAGMGKTTFCLLIAEHLFGDQKFGRISVLSGKTVQQTIHGVPAPYEGNNQPTDLIQFAQSTHGLGVYCFDEFTRIMLPNQQTLSEGLGSFLDILQQRYFEPTNPNFRPPSGIHYLTNTLFVFSANVSRTGQTGSAGFTSFETLGDAFNSRIHLPLYFDPLRREEYPEAIRYALQQSAKSWARDFAPDAPCLNNAPINIDNVVVTAIERQFQAELSHTSEAPSIRRIQSLVQPLPYKRSFAKAAEAGQESLLLSQELIPAEWL